MKYQPFLLRRFEISSIKRWQSIIFGHKGRNLQLDVISSKMRETILVGGKLSSCIPHHEGSERNNLVEEVEKGLDPF